MYTPFLTFERSMLGLVTDIFEERAWVKLSRKKRRLCIRFELSSNQRLDVVGNICNLVLPVRMLIFVREI